LLLSFAGEPIKTAEVERDTQTKISLESNKVQQYYAATAEYTLIKINQYFGQSSTLYTISKTAARATPNKYTLTD